MHTTPVKRSTSLINEQTERISKPIQSSNTNRIAKQKFFCALLKRRAPFIEFFIMI